MIDVAMVDGKPYLGIASFGFDSDANRIANDARVVRGNLVYLYAALRALVSWQARPLHGRPSTASATRSTATPWRSPTRAPTAAACSSRPNAELDDGALDVVMIERTSKLRFLRSLPKVFKGTHVADPNVQVLPRLRGGGGGRPAVRHLRRRRPRRRRFRPP